VPHVKGLKTGTIIWCFLCGHHCKCEVSSSTTKWGYTSTYPKCIHCDYGLSCGVSTPNNMDDVVI